MRPRGTAYGVPRPQPWQPWQLTQVRDYPGGPRRWQLALEVSGGEQARAVQEARGGSGVMRSLDDALTWPGRYLFEFIDVTAEEMLAIAGGADPLDVLLHGPDGARRWLWPLVLRARPLSLQEMLG